MTPYLFPLRPPQYCTQQKCSSSFLLVSIISQVVGAFIVDTVKAPDWWNGVQHIVNPLTKALSCYKIFTSPLSFLNSDKISTLHTFLRSPFLQKFDVTILIFMRKHFYNHYYANYWPTWNAVATCCKQR